MEHVSPARFAFETMMKVQYEDGYGRNATATTDAGEFEPLLTERDCLSSFGFSHEDLHNCIGKLFLGYLAIRLACLIELARDKTRLEQLDPDAFDARLLAASSTPPPDGGVERAAAPAGADAEATTTANPLSAPLLPDTQEGPAADDASSRSPHIAAALATPSPAAVDGEWSDGDDDDNEHDDAAAFAEDHRPCAHGVATCDATVSEAEVEPCKGPQRASL